MRISWSSVAGWGCSWGDGGGHWCWMIRGCVDRIGDVVVVAAAACRSVAVGDGETADCSSF